MLRIRTMLTLFVVGLMTISPSVGRPASVVGGNSSIGMNAYLYRGGVWHTLLIPVCWQAEGYDRDKATVRRYVEATWERESSVDFIGWDRCNSSLQPGIHIIVGDVNPQVFAFGQDLNGRDPGMVLNFEFRRWPCALPHDICVGSIAVHEFGHALGFRHEQDRPDTPSWCTEPASHEGPVETMIEEWDEHSIMNYCTKNGYNNYGSLSAGDVSALRRHYQAPVYKAVPNGENLLAAAWAGNEAGVRQYLTPETFNARSREGLNALMMAADRCYLGIAQFILNSGILNGPDINTRNIYHNTALEIAKGTPRELREQGIVRPRCPQMVPMLEAFYAQ